ncbi:MAG: signal peptidase II [Acidobacteriota bacterium]
MIRGRVLRIAYALVSLSILGLDQLAKELVVSRMVLSSSVAVIPGLFHLTLVTNRGALFGLFHDLPDPYRNLLFIVIPVLAILMILGFQYRTTLADVVAQTGLALILGGAVGNLVDRLRLGYVIDFLDFFIGDHHWPAFNLADASICVGVALLVSDLLVRGRSRSRPTPPSGG